MVPLVTIVAIAIGISAGGLMVVAFTNVTASDFSTGLHLTFIPFQVYYALIKATLFGGAIALIGSYEGYTAEAGAEGVGSSTARTVVISSVVILLLDALTALYLAPQLKHEDAETKSSSGLFVTFTVAVSIAGTLYLARRGFTKSYPMYARFDWGQNLKVGQPVYLAGVQVGSVQVVDLNADGYLDVRLQIDRDRKIPEGSTVTVLAEGIFGDKSVAIKPSSDDGNIVRNVDEPG